MSKRWPLIAWRRTPKLAPIRWHTSTQLIRANFRALYADKEVGGVFDDEYAKALTARRIEKQSQANKLIVFNMTLLAFMAAWLFMNDLKFSFLGLTVERVDQLIEFVRVVAGLLGAYLGILQLEIRQAGAVLDEISQAKSPKASAYYKMSWAVALEGSVDVAPAPNIYVGQSRALQTATRAWSILILIVSVLFILAATAVSVAVTWSMIESPSLGPIVSRIMAMVALLCDAAGLGLLCLMYSPLPMRDYKDVMETQPIFEREGPDAWWAEMQARLARRKLDE